MPVTAAYDASKLIDTTLPELRSKLVYVPAPARTMRAVESRLQGSFSIAEETGSSYSKGHGKRKTSVGTEQGQYAGARVRVFTR